MHLQANSIIHLAYTKQYNTYCHTKLNMSQRVIFVLTQASFNSLFKLTTVHDLACVPT